MAEQYGPLRMIVDGNTDVFRYGLTKFEESAYEDPIFCGFTVEIDDGPSSAFFNQALPFLEKKGTNRVELSSRVPVYNEFKSKIVQVFKSQESVASPEEKSIYIKSHYINTVSNLDVLNKKFIDWRKDSLEFEMHEDIAMYSTYLASLYNNLVYSYDTGRQMIPENLLKFNMYIKISNIKNLTSIGKLLSNDPSDQQIASALKDNVTCMVYKLTDCEFDFFESKPITDEITQAGIDAGLVGNSVLKMRIYFKSVNREIYTPLIKSSISMNDSLTDLGVVIVGYSGNSNPNGQAIGNSSTATSTNGAAFVTQTVNTSSGAVAPSSAFVNQTDKKPSDFSTYTIETNINPDIAEPNDLSGKAQQLQDLMAFNQSFGPPGPTVDNSQQTGNLSGNLGGHNIGLTNLINDPVGALANVASNIVKAVENTLLTDLHKEEQILREKRNALVSQFVNDVIHKVGIKKIVPDNVYTDPNYFKEITGSDVLNQLGADIGFGILGNGTGSGAGGLSGLLTGF